MLRRYVAMTCLLISPMSYAAALMGFEDSAMWMSEIGRYNQEFMVNYSPALGHAVGVEVMRMSGKREQATTITGLHYTGLLKRWNMPAAQANLWVAGSVGEAQGQHSGFSYTPSVQFDIETTRLYFLAKARLIRADGMRYDMAAVQAGFSLYETGFDQTQPWFVVEAKAMRDTIPNMQITPALRLINKNYFVELGVTNPFDANERAPRVNLMLVF